MSKTTSRSLGWLAAMLLGAVMTLALWDVGKPKAASEQPQLVGLVPPEVAVGLATRPAYEPTARYLPVAPDPTPKITPTSP